MYALAKTLLRILALGLLVGAPRPLLADAPLTGTPTTFGPARLELVVAGVGLESQPATLSVTVPAGATVEAAWLYVSGRGSGDASVLLNGMTTSLPLVESSGPLPFAASQSAELRRLPVTLATGSNTFTIDGYDQTDAGGAFVVAVVSVATAPIRTIALLEGADYAFADFAPPFGPDTQTAAFTFSPVNAARTARLVLFAHDALPNRGDATWLLAADSFSVPRPARLVGGTRGAQRVQRNLLGVPSSAGGLSRGAEFDVDDRSVAVPSGADYLAFQIESAHELTGPDSLVLSLAALVLPASGDDGGGGSTTSTTLNGGGGSTTSTTLDGGGGSTTSTTLNGGGGSTSTTLNGGGGSTTSTTLNGGGGSTSTTLNGGGGSTTSTTLNGGGGSTSTTLNGGGSSTSTTLNGGGATTTTTPTSATTSTTTPGGAPPPPNCGDGIVNPDEECDDANQVAGDGCSACAAEDTAETWKLSLRVRHLGLDRLVYFTMLRDVPSALLGTAPVHITLSSGEFQMLDAVIPASAFRVRPTPVLVQPDAVFARAAGRFGIWRIKLRFKPLTGIRAYDVRLFVKGEMLPEMFGRIFLTTVIRIGSLPYVATDPIRANRSGKYLRYIHPVLPDD